MRVGVGACAAGAKRKRAHFATAWATRAMGTSNAHAEGFQHVGSRFAR